LHLTHGDTYEGGSAFYNIPQNIGAFTATFTYHNSTSYGPADGFTFTLQNQGLSAVGGYGLNLGFGGITNGAAIAFNLYTGYGAGTKSPPAPPTMSTAAISAFPRSIWMPPIL